MQTTLNNTIDETMVRMVLDRWNSAMKTCDELISSLSDGQLDTEIAPDKNRGIYVLGHLIAVHDNMLPLLEMGDKKYTTLNKLFIDLPDKKAEKIPSAAELRSTWKDQKGDLEQQFDRLTAEQWFERHTAVSADDFVKEPHRNKLNIVLTRTTHLFHHIGQLALLKSSPD